MFQYESFIRVRYGETDQMGFLYYGYYALYYEQGRGDAMRSLQASYKDLEEKGIFMPVVRMECKYIKPAHYDDLIRVVTKLKTLPDGHFMVFESYLYNEQNELLNKGTVTLAFMDQVTKAKIKAPQYLVDTLLPFFNK